MADKGELHNGTRIERSAMDDTFPGWPKERANREGDYKRAWAVFEGENQSWPLI